MKTINRPVLRVSGGSSKNHTEEVHTPRGPRAVRRLPTSFKPVSSTKSFDRQAGQCDPAGWVRGFPVRNSAGMVVARRNFLSRQKRFGRKYAEEEISSEPRQGGICRCGGMTAFRKDTLALTRTRGLRSGHAATVVTQLVPCESDRILLVEVTSVSSSHERWRVGKRMSHPKNRLTFDAKEASF